MPNKSPIERDEGALDRLEAAERAADEALAYNVKAAAAALRISEWLMRKELRQHKVCHTKVGTRLVIPRWALEERLGRPEPPLRPAAIEVNGAGY